jgi:hypothetical protein
LTGERPLRDYRHVLTDPGREHAGGVEAVGKAQRRRSQATDRGDLRISGMHLLIDLPLATASFDLPNSNLDGGISEAVTLLRQAHVARERRGEKPSQLTAVIYELRQSKVDARFFRKHVRAKVQLRSRNDAPRIKLCDRGASDPTQHLDAEVRS